MRLVDDDGEALAAMLVADLVEDEREFLDGGDDDLLAALQKLAEVARLVSVADSRADLGELFDGVADLLVENAPVGDDNNRVENRGIVRTQCNKLMGEPSDRVRLAAAGRMLDQIALAYAVLDGVGEEFPHNVELLVAGPDLNALLFAGLFVLGFDDLRVVF